MTAPLISVIMPAFNRATTIAYAIESVLAQSHRHLELILVDDASTDATAAIMALYERHDPRVRIVRNATNSRSSPIQWEPRNNGLQLARGSLIAYLDSDNLWHPDYLRICARAFRADRAVQLVHCNSRNHYRDTRQFRRVLRNDQRRLIESDAESLSAAFSFDVYHGAAGLSWYIDTNEMMHRASVFHDLDHLWATRHPNRQAINESQLVRCRYRRHNDQELAQRIISRYGLDCVCKLDRVLVDFFYAPRQSAFQPLSLASKVGRLLGTSSGVRNTADCLPVASQR